MASRLRPNPKRFRQWCRRARKLWPLDKPVRIRRERKLTGHCTACFGKKPDPTCPSCKGKGRYAISGECYESADGSHYIIRIDGAMCRSAVFDTLIHEWTHLLRGEYDRNDDGAHDDAFWTLHGELYRCWHERGGSP